MPDKAKWVWSDTLGLLRDRCGDIHLTKPSLRYPEVVEVMSRWLTDRLPGTEAKGFTFTSLNVNKNYAARIHRDGNNFGPSMISAFGDFTGGKLKYYPHDDGKIDLEKLQSKTANKADHLDLQNGLCLFNGNSAHSVDDFEGSRYSIVFFTLGCHSKMGAEARKQLQGMGVVAPEPDEDPYKIIRAPLGERSSRRYSQVATPSRAGGGAPALPAPLATLFATASAVVGVCGKHVELAVASGGCAGSLRWRWTCSSVAGMAGAAAAAGPASNAREGEEAWC